MTTKANRLKIIREWAAHVAAVVFLGILSPLLGGEPPAPVLEFRIAGYLPDYRAADYDLARAVGLSTVPVEKVVLDSMGVRDAVELLLTYEPAYRLLFHPGSARRHWRLVNVLQSAVETVTLNRADASEPTVLAADLRVSWADRAGAVQIEGPESARNALSSTSDGSLMSLWSIQEGLNFAAGGPTAPGIGLAGKAWQVSDPTRRRTPLLPPVAVAPDLGPSTLATPTRRLTVAVSFDGGATFMIRADASIDRQQGIITLSEPAYVEEAGVFRLPDVVRFWHGVYDLPARVRCPASGQDGSAHAWGVGSPIRRSFDEGLNLRYHLGLPEPTLLNGFSQVACQQHAALRDVVVEGQIVFAGLDYRWRHLDRRLLLQALDGSGAVTSLGLEATLAIVTQAEYDFAAKTTTIMLSSDYRSILQASAEAQRERLEVFARLARSPAGRRFFFQFGGS